MGLQGVASAAGAFEDDEIVDERPPVELLFDARHHNCLDFSDRICIVFESESLMLVMN